MDISGDEHHQTRTFEPGDDVGCIEHQNDDYKVKSGNPAVEVGDIDACEFTSLMVDTADLLKCSTVAVNSDGISEEESKGCVVTNDGEFPVSCKSACPLTVSEADLSKCGASTEVNGSSVEKSEERNVKDGISEEESKGCVVTNDGEFPVSCKSACPLTVSEADLSKCEASKEVNGSSVEKSEERNVKDDDGDLTACKLTPLVSVYEADNSKCLGSVEGKVSVVENVNGASDKDAQNSQSRERKKSKYLCPPFVGLGKGSKVLPNLEESEVDDAKSPGNPSLLVKCSKRKREPRKSLADSVKLETITASSAELLLQLHMVALDHLNPYYNRVFDSTLALFNSFRISVFRGLSNSEVMGVVDIQTDDAGRDEGDADFHPQVEKKNKISVRKTRKDKGETRSDRKSPGLYDVNVNFTACSPASGSTKPQRKRKRKEAITSSPTVPNQTSGVPDEPKAETGKKKRIRKKGVTPGIPFVNGKGVSPISLEVCLQDAGPYPVPASTGLDANIANSLGETGTKPKMPAPQSPEFQTPEKANHATGLDTPDKYSAELTLDQMKKSLELMTSMLENSSSTISPETRAKLENEIKNLLKKVNPMVSPSS